jgi:hypothetical protein
MLEKARRANELPNSVGALSLRRLQRGFSQTDPQRDLTRRKSALMLRFDNQQEK